MWSSLLKKEEDRVRREQEKAEFANQRIERLANELIRMMEQNAYSVGKSKTQKESDKADKKSGKKKKKTLSTEEDMSAFKNLTDVLDQFVKFSGEKEMEVKKVN